MRYKKIMILTLILAFLLTVSAVSAAENATDDIVSVEDSTDIDNMIVDDSNSVLTSSNVGEDILNAKPQSFTDLNRAINGNNNAKIDLTNNYTYSAGDESFTNGVKISRDVTIDGHGITIDGSKSARIFQIVKGTVTFKNINFVNGYVKGYGGAINAKCNAIGCNFTSNSASYNGGAMHGGVAINCSFKNNTARDESGGAMYDGTANNCTFINNAAGSIGGAMYGGTANNCTFINNTAGSKVGGGDGGAMYCGNANNCTFINNTAGGDGGAMGHGVANYCIFINNTARDGGAMVNGVANYCIFINNTAAVGGGAICLSNYGAVNNCIFINNTATGGGAVDIFYSRAVDVNNCIFINNAASDGGALSIDGNMASNVNNCIFINNSAYDGGALFITGTANNCTFINNSALRGGAMYSDYYDSDDYGVAVKCRFINNSATDFGGAIYRGYMNKCIFINNTAPTGNDTYKTMMQTQLSIIANSVITVYNGGKNLIITFRNSAGKGISDLTVNVVLSNGVKKYYNTNYLGRVAFTTNGLAPKTYVVTIKHESAGPFEKSTKTVKIIVKKANPKLAAPAKTYKVKAAKNYIVTLKTNQNKVMKNSWITLNVNKKTYKVKTNAKGQAIFKITNLKKKGKFTAVVKFAGNKYYNAKIVKPKITVK